LSDESIAKQYAAVSNNGSFFLIESIDRSPTHVNGAASAFVKLCDQSARCTFARIVNATRSLRYYFSFTVMPASSSFLSLHFSEDEEFLYRENSPDFYTRYRVWINFRSVLRPLPIGTRSTSILEKLWQSAKWPINAFTLTVITQVVSTSFYSFNKFNKF